MQTRTIGLSILVVLILAIGFLAGQTNMHSMLMGENATTTSTSVPDTTSNETVPSVPSKAPVYNSGDMVTVTAHVGETVTALGEKITPISVVDDSRCPKDVQCVWAGTVHIKAMVEGGMGKATMTFELNKEMTTEVNTITLVDVVPTKVSTHEISPAEYIFTFKVVRN